MAALLCSTLTSINRSDIGHSVIIITVVCLVVFELMLRYTVVKLIMHDHRHKLKMITQPKFVKKIAA